MSITAAKVHFICWWLLPRSFPALHQLHPWVMPAHQGKSVLLRLVPPPVIRLVPPLVQCSLYYRDKIMPFHLFSLPFTESFANLLLVSLKVNTFRITWILSGFYLTFGPVCSFELLNHENEMSTFDHLQWTFGNGKFWKWRHYKTVEHLEKEVLSETWLLNNFQLSYPVRDSLLDNLANKKM